MALNWGSGGFFPVMSLLRSEASVASAYARVMTR